MRKRIAATVVAASALTGGVIGLTVFGPSTVGAKSGAPTTTVQQATPPGAGKAADKADHRGHGFGGRHESVSDESVAAKAIGISEANLTKELRSGKTIAQIAKAHGVSVEKVIDELVADAKTELAADVKAGRLTQAQADQAQTKLKQRITGQVNGTFRHGPGSEDGKRGFGGHGLRGRGRFGGAPAIAKALGISETDLAKELRSGKTIAQVAKAHGVTTKKVIDALVADVKTKLAAAVKAGRLTQAQADRVQTGLTKGITNLVNGTWPKGFGGGRPGRGFGPLHD